MDFGDVAYRTPVESLGLIPPSKTEDWTLLGYDVADAGLTSGLSNCGYRPSELAQLRASWAAQLNGHHLFEEFGSALAFRDVTARRVPEHAPFFVYALWRDDSG
ncbi:hypothetical protein JGU66_30225 [Myxococcaceae bacterium JPH2]|nr:hypothetical protein [Myxococcaceae bacterium JPH2]